MIFLELALFQAPDGTGSVGIPFWTMYASRLIYWHCATTTEVHFIFMHYRRAFLYDDFQLSEVHASTHDLFNTVALHLCLP